MPPRGRPRTNHSSFVTKGRSEVTVEAQNAGFAEGWQAAVDHVLAHIGAPARSLRTAEASDEIPPA